MTREPWQIVLAEKFATTAIERIRAVGEVTILDDFGEESLKAAVGNCDALLVRTYARVSREVLERAKRLRVIGRGGVGLENIDLEAARERGITVVYTPAAATDSVAELTIGLMIGLVRRISAGDAAVRSGRLAEVRQSWTGRELSELTLGIVGLGRIGRAVARRCRRGFGMSILYNDIVAPGWLDFAATAVGKEELYARSDIISLHVPLTDQTHHLIDDDALAKFKSGAVLINTARGAVVENGALARALTSGPLAGAALDVFDPEPPPADDVLLGAPNTLFTPHIGARTERGLDRMNDVVNDVIRVLEGEPPRFPA